MVRFFFFAFIRPDIGPKGNLSVIVSEVPEISLPKPEKKSGFGSEVFSEYKARERVLAICWEGFSPALQAE